MRNKERWNYLLKSPKLAWDISVCGRYDFRFDLMSVHVPRMSLKKRLNLLRSGMNLVHRRLLPWSWPINMVVELNNYCNIKCTVCPTGIGMLERRPKAMEPALFQRLVDEAGPYLLTMTLGGWGEPMLHPELSEILRIIQNRGITTFFFTNGQNLNNEKVLEALINYPPTYLIVAIDGITDETNSKYRVGAKLEPALKGVQQLAQMKAAKGQHLPILHWRYIVMKHNEHELPQLQEFAADNQFDILTIRTLSIIDAPDDTHLNLIPSDENYRAYGYEDDKRIIRTDFICEKAFTFPGVFADGTVVACDQDSNAHQPFGSIADGTSFADVWWSREAAQIRRTIRDNPDNFSFCSNCPFRDRPVSTCSIQYFDIRKQ